jgi:hypothetical protein
LRSIAVEHIQIQFTLPGKASEGEVA